MTDTGCAPLLEASGLTKTYGDFRLDGVNLAVEPGTIVGLVGTNGAGKTTLIKSLLGLVRPDGGQAKLFGRSMWERGNQRAAVQEAAQVKEHVGVVFDGVSFPGELRVRDVARVMPAAYRAWDATLFGSYLERFGLDGRKRVKELSRGMGMKLMLACALSHAADLLILDEATAGLDPMAREEILGILRDFMVGGEGRGILLATHITSDLEHIADYVVCLDAGKLAFSLEKDAISDMAGIARCRVSEFEQVLDAGGFEGARFVRNSLNIDVLVPDRRDFAHAFPHIALDRADIESYMSLTLKGEPIEPAYGSTHH